MAGGISISRLRGLNFRFLPHDDHWKHVRLQHHQNSHQRRQYQTVEEHVPKDVAFVTVPAGGCAGHDDRLRVDHLAHHAAGTVGCAHQDWTETELRRSDLLQTAEQDI